MMHRNLKRFLACLCAVMLTFSCTGALAEFSSRLDALRQKDSVIVELTGKYTALNKLSKKSLETVNGWLSTLKATAQGQLGGLVTSVSVTSDGEEILSIVSQKQENGTVTEFKPSGNAYLTGDNQPSALSLLTGKETHLFDPLEIPQLYEKLAKALYPVLEGKVTPKTKKSPTGITKGVKAASYVEYVFKGNALNDAWPEILSAVMPILQEALADQPERSTQMQTLLGNLTFSGECRFKRFLSKDQADMGLQFTGNAGKDGDVRKVTLFGGYSADKGGYLSLKLPQVKGKNNLTLQLTMTLAGKSSARTLKTDLKYNRSFNGVKESLTVSGNLKNTVKNSDEKWTGKLTVSKTEGKTKTTYTLTPDLAFTDEGLSGKITVQRKAGGKQDMKATLQLTAKEAEPAAVEDNENVNDLTEKSTAQAKAAVQGELPELTRLVVRLMSTLPEEERTLLTHELHTDKWMTMAPAEEPADDAAEQDAEAPADDDEAPGDEEDEDAEPADETDEKPADEEPADEESKEAPKEDQPADKEDEGDYWEDAEDDGDWPAAAPQTDNSQPAQETADQQPAEDAEDEEESAQNDAGDGEEAGDDDWFGDDWFGDDEEGEEE